MKIIFNDTTELQVQKVEQKGDYLRVLTVSATPEQLRRIFEDIVKTATMVVEERGQKGEPLVGYTTFYRVRKSIRGKFMELYSTDQKELQKHRQKCKKLQS